MRTIGADHEVETNLDLLGAASWCGRALSRLHLEPGLAAAKVGSGELVVEIEGNIGHPFEDVQQPLVQPATVDSIYCLEGRK